MTLDENNKPLGLLTVNEVCRYMKVSRNTLKKWIKDGRFPPPLIDCERCHRWSYDDLSKLISRI